MEQVARDRSKVLTETLADMLRLDDVLACRTIPFRERLTAAKRLESLRADAGALLMSIVLSE